MLKPIQKNIAYGIFLILLIFIFRVAAQFTQLVYPLPHLPSFESWQSGVLPYPLLFLLQLLIIIFMTIQCLKFAKGKIRPSLTKGKMYLCLGSLYFSIMAVRFIGGLTFAAHHYWFSAKIPTFFHLVLASFLILVGYYHTRYLKNACRL